MVSEITILVSSGTALYFWLSVTCAPVLSAIRTIARDPRDLHSWGAAGLAISTGVLWTGIATGALLLLMTFAPAAALAIVESPVRSAGGLAGSAVWIIRSAWIGVPRLGIDAEIASALAVVSLFRDDVETLRSIEALYRERVLVLPTSAARRAPIGVAMV